MLKIVIYVIVFIIGGTLLTGAFHLCRVHFKNKKEMAPYMDSAVEMDKNLGKVLVVYYSLSGNTRDIAERIRRKTNADIYEIKTAEPLNAGPSLYTSSKKQISTKQYPALAGQLPDFSGYDMIFVGAPIWWYTAATPVLSFLALADFQGKKVVPFSTQGSNPGTFIEDFRTNAKNAVILNGAEFNNLSEKYNNAVDNKITVWLNGLAAQ